MSEESSKNRTQLLRILLIAVIAALTLLITVGGMVGYSAQVVDRLQVENEHRLAARRIERTLDRLRENIVSATAWNEAYVETLAGDQAWMQINYGDYFADYMDHQVSVAFDQQGRLFYASRDSEPVAPGSEAAFARAVGPLVEAVRLEAAALRQDAGGQRRYGLEAISTRQQLVSVDGRPFLVAVSNVVPEEADFAISTGPDPIVASGVSVASFLPSLTADIGLAEPVLIPPGAASKGPAVDLVGPRGETLGRIGWTPDRPGWRLLMNAAGPLGLLVLVLGVALVIGGVRVYRLIRDLAYNEQALDRSLADAEAGNAAKSQFLANMSHELRTPLNGVIAMTELLHAHQIDDRGREMAATIVASGRTLEQVVNDILDVSKIEAGQLKFEIAPFDLESTLRRVTDLHAAAAAAKGVTLTCRIAPAAKGAYAGDPTRVCQVISNLLSNAVKFTATGSVRLTARMGPGGLAIAVADTGIGFDRATARKLFQRFEQADVSMSRRYGGTGLGLSICTSLIEMMGGRIAVRSAPGRGSVFVAHMPLPRASLPAPAPAPAAQSVVAGVGALDRPARVLFAEDHEVNRRVVTLILEPLDIDLTVVENGALALAAATETPFDLILMDVQMPEMDGLTATRLIRAHEAQHGLRRAPIISLTANALADDVARSLEAGSDLHLAKPIRPDALLAAVAALLNAAGEADALAA
jgi:signal transduction histidine kinase/ActR/RegA family two-component response regulator